MWDRIWINASIATMAAPATGETVSPYGAIENGAVAAEGGRIAWVGAMADLPGPAESLAREVVDAGGQWILPGLVDCHTHLVYGGDRAREFEMRLEGASYEEIAAAGGGIVSTVRATRETDEDTLFKHAEKRLKSLMAEGVTTVEIKSGYGLDAANERKMLRVARRLGKAHPVRVRTTFLGAHALPAEFKDNPDGYIDDVCGTQLPAVAKEGLADAVDAFCEKIAFTPEQTARVFAAAHAHRLPVKLHADQLSDLGGAALASRFDALSADHLEYTSADGVAAMAKAGAVAVLLPGAFYILRESKLPPMEAFREHGVPMALATDGNPGSSPIFSLLTILNMGCTLFRMTPEEALAGVTRNGARALGMADEIGTIEAGKRADFALFDIAHPAELSYRIGQNPLTGRIVDGVPA